jgi:hypothetical protein
VLKPGFHAQNGSTFHAFIKKDCAKPPENVPVYTTFQEHENLLFDETMLAEDSRSLTESSISNENQSKSDNNIQVVSQAFVSRNDKKLPDEPNTRESALWFALRNDE